MEKLFCSDRSVITEPRGTELVFFGWGPAQVIPSFCFGWKTIPLCFLRFPHLLRPHFPLPSSHGEAVWLSRARAGAMWGITALCGGAKCADFQRIPPSLQSAALNQSSVTGQLWKAVKKVRGSSCLPHRGVTALALADLHLRWCSLGEAVTGFCCSVP